MSRMWAEEDIPEEVVLCELIAIYKKGDSEQMANYRMIGLLTHLYKMLTTLLTWRTSRGFCPKVKAVSESFVRPGTIFFFWRKSWTQYWLRVQRALSPLLTSSLPLTL